MLGPAANNNRLPTWVRNFILSQELESRSPRLPHLQRAADAVWIFCRHVHRHVLEVAFVVAPLLTDSAGEVRDLQTDAKCGCLVTCMWAATVVKGNWKQ